MKSEDSKSLIFLQNKIEEQGKEILELKNENEVLKKQMNEAFQNIISIYNRLNKYNNLDNYVNKINNFQLNFLYNSLDDQLYKLEDSFKNMNHELIKSRKELGLINTGVKRQLKSNIGKCVLKYKASVHGKNPTVFHLKCDNIFYSLFIIKTTNERRFGVFFCNNNNNKVKLNYNSNDNVVVNNNYLYKSYNSFNTLYYDYFSNRDNYPLNNNMSEDFNVVNNSKKNEIFNCKSKPDKFFAFSLNNLRIYYPNIKNIENTPCFSINYDPNRESYYGQEKKVNINAQIKEFILSGKEEFNILEFEVYEIII
jgi:hypothetical protein